VLKGSALNAARPVTLPKRNRARGPSSLRAAGVSMKETANEAKNELEEATELGLMVIGIKDTGLDYPGPDLEDDEQLITLTTQKLR
jgi:hypothetical protein